MIRTLALTAAAAFVIAALCLGGAAALAGPEIARSAFWRDFDWQHFDANHEFDPTAPVVTQARDLSDFTSVAVGGGLRAEITAGQDFGVEVIGAEPDLVATDVLGSRLTVQPVRSRSWWRAHRRALVRISMPAIDGLAASAGAQAVASGVAAETLDLDASSGARLEISGACTTISAEASSGATIAADDLICESGQADASSGARIDVHVTGRLDVEASSGGSVRAEGDPQIGDLSLSSGGALNRD